MDVKIEFAKIENLEDIQNLNLMLFKKEQKEYDSTFDLNWTFSEEGIKFFSNSIEKEDACALLAKSENKIVGYLVGWIRESDSFRTIGKQAEIEDMIVLKEFRDQQIGKRLVDKFFQWVKKNGVKNITVSASAQNKKAIDFYRKHGFNDYVSTLEINLN